MPAKVIATMHKLDAACKKYKGIVFTDKDGNTINYNNDKDDNTLEITGVDTTATETDTIETTGVDMTETNNNTGETRVENNDAEHTTGLGNNITGVHINKHSIAPDTDKELNIKRDNQNKNYEKYDDYISIKHQRTYT